MRILVTGAKGRLGNRLMQILADYDISGIDIDSLNVTDFAATRAHITELKPDVVIHAAAWTDVDGCAREPERATQINGYGTQNVALSAAAAGAAMLYVSSNEVFDGQAKRPYYEYDPRGPVNPYGYSKFVGEQCVKAATTRHYIVRTSWLFAHGGKNFLQAILGAAEAGKTLRVVTDEIANPTYNDDLADAIATLIVTERFGSYHLTNTGACSRYAFARYTLDQCGYADTPIIPISRHQWPRPSTPPVYSSLANLAAQSIGITLRPWQAAVDTFLEKEGLSI